jgi:anti-sigma B factor antagonist
MTETGHRATLAFRSRTLMIDERVSGGVTILDIRGNLTIDMLRDMIVLDLVRELIQRDRMSIIINLAEVKQLDTMGLCNIVEAFITLRRKGGVLKLLGVSQHVREVLKVTRLLPLFEIYDSEAAAVASFEQASNA